MFKTLNFFLEIISYLGTIYIVSVLCIFYLIKYHLIGETSIIDEITRNQISNPLTKIIGVYFHSFLIVYLVQIFSISLLLVFFRKTKGRYKLRLIDKISIIVIVIFLVLFIIDKNGFGTLYDFD